MSLESRSIFFLSRIRTDKLAKTAPGSSGASSSSPDPGGSSLYIGLFPIDYYSWGLSWYMSHDLVWIASVDVGDKLPFGMYFRIPPSICKALHLHHCSSLTVLTLGVTWSGRCFFQNRLYIRIPSQVSQACGFSPGQSVELRAIPKA